MPRRFLTDAAKAALERAVAGVESRSSAEVVVLVRSRSAAYRHADLLAGGLAAYLVLAFQLFSPWEFELWSILVAPPICGLLVALAVSRLDPVRRLLIPAAERREHVRVAARAAFLEQGVGETRRRTGILVYVSLLERVVELIPDCGVRQSLPAAAWSDLVAGVEQAMRSREPGLAVAERLTAFGNALGPVLPHREDDVDELPNAVGVA